MKSQIGARDETRTRHLLFTRQVLYQMSYSGWFLQDTRRLSPRVLAIRISSWNDAPVALSKHEIDLIDFERSWWSSDQPKDAEIVDQFGLTTAEFYEQLHQLIDSPEALAHDPLVVRRLRRMRDRRRRERLGEMADSAGS